jgi:chitodextrinase
VDGREYGGRVGRTWGLGRLLGVLGVAATAASVAPAAEAATFTRVPEADSFVSAATPTTNYGAWLRVRADADPSETSYIRFDLTGVSPVSRAVLRLWQLEGSGGTTEVRRVADDSWGERSINHSNAPPVGTESVSFGPTPSPGWQNVDVTSLVGTGGGKVTLALTTSSTEVKTFRTREDAKASPRLEVDTVEPPGTPGDRVIAAAGDISCDPASSSYNGGLGTATRCRQKYTSDLLVGGGFDAVLPLGDNQYTSGTLSQYQTAFEPSWGRVKSLLHPVPGNHEYRTSGAAGYFDYFNGTGNSSGPAGERTRGYYSWNLGSWHMVALNSSCHAVGGCGPGSPQEQWLRADLAAHPASCTLAYWHHPRFTSAVSSHDDGATAALWQALYEARADVVLTGHSHMYERFAPQDPSGAADPASGIRQFVVGTGGEVLHPFGGFASPNSGARQNNTYGVLRLVLRENDYEWRFLPEAGKTYSDSGADVCEGPKPDSAVPSTPTNLVPSPTASNLVTLTWWPSTDDDGVSSYRVFRNGTQVATTRTPTYVDRDVTAGTTYTYNIRAVDPAGNVSNQSSTKTVTTPTGSSLSFAPDDDAEVRSDDANGQFGSRATILADASPDRDSLLKFTVSGVGSQQVTGAKLRVYDLDRAPVGGDVFRLGDSNWEEETVTWATAPAADPTPLGSVPTGWVREGSWYEIDLPGLVTGDGTYSVRLSSTSGDDAVYASKDNEPETAPRLVVTTGP